MSLSTSVSQTAKSLRLLENTREAAKWILKMSVQKLDMGMKSKRGLDLRQGLLIVSTAHRARHVLQNLAATAPPPPSQPSSTDKTDTRHESVVGHGSSLEMDADGSDDGKLTAVVMDFNSPDIIFPQTMPRCLPDDQPTSGPAHSHDPSNAGQLDYSMCIVRWMLQVMILPLCLGNNIQRCCMEWLEPCKCPALYITPDMRRCGSEVMLTELNMPIKRFKAARDVILMADYYSVIFLASSRKSGSIAGVRYRLLYARINVPRDQFVGMLEESEENGSVIAVSYLLCKLGKPRAQAAPVTWFLSNLDYNANTIIDELTPYKLVHDSCNSNALTRLTAFMVPQTEYREQPVEIGELKANLRREDVEKLFPGEPVAASSYILRHVQSEYDGKSSKARGLTVEWIAPLETNGVDIIDANTGGYTINNRFRDWLQSNEGNS
ncbi:unnamed protein product [Mesocestoides corti]|uniref:START domain-containing protein n=1 Tax=Mesocestoides corti TaxID=53468 RepID=A0A0R3U5P4_MESCO|nr:unnamed protein product [Mesocestoides corti]